MSVEQLNDLGQNLRSVLGAQIVLPQETQQLNINLDRQKMAIYGITPENIQNALADLSGDRQFSTLHDFSNYVPVSFSTDSENMDINSWIETQTVKNLAGNEYPLKYFISLSTEQTFKNIESGLQGKYIPIGIQRVKNISQMEKNIQKLMEKYPELDYNLSGSVYQNRKMFSSLILILFISIVLMYLIMTAQFESFIQPLILLTEIPVDMAAGLIFLMLFGETMNIMSAIGLIVTCGVVVNDSILKVNVINELRDQGVPLKIAIHEAGRKRVRAIVMTSLTSIFALVPILPSHDLGSEMQKPFAVAMIGAMLIGTLFSLFFIPLFYWLVYRNSETENNNPKVSSDKILLS
jgi:multidrug efflux pump subunit AcrB